MVILTGRYVVRGSVYEILHDYSGRRLAETNLVCMLQGMSMVEDCWVSQFTLICLVNDAGCLCLVKSSLVCPCCTCCYCNGPIPVHLALMLFFELGVPCVDVE